MSSNSEKLPVHILCDSSTSVFYDERSKLYLNWASRLGSRCPRGVLCSPPDCRVTPLWGNHRRRGRSDQSVITEVQTPAGSCTWKPTCNYQLDRQRPSQVLWKNKSQLNITFPHTDITGSKVRVFFLSSSQQAQELNLTNPRF